MVVESLSVRGFRNLAACDVELGPRITLLWGPNGAGKTNLLEATYTALAGPLLPDARRPRDDRVRRVAGARGGGGRGRRAAPPLPVLDQPRARGAATWSTGRPLGADAAALRPALAVFMPDRLALVKGPPAARRTHFDGFCAALWPTRGEARRRYARALAQRNALLGRIRAGSASSGDPRRLGPRAGRRRGRADRDPRRGGRAPGARVRGVGGVAGPRARAAELRYRPRSQATDGGGAGREIGERRDSDLARGYTGCGPAPRRRSRSSSASARCAATAPRASSGPRSWRCCSPSAGPCSTRVARRRSCCSTTSPPSSTPSASRAAGRAPRPGWRPGGDHRDRARPAAAVGRAHRDLVARRQATRRPRPSGRHDRARRTAADRRLDPGAARGGRAGHPARRGPGQLGRRSPASGSPRRPGRCASATGTVTVACREGDVGAGARSAPERPSRRGSTRRSAGRGCGAFASSSARIPSLDSQ